MPAIPSLALAGGGIFATARAGVEDCAVPIDEAAADAAQFDRVAVRVSRQPGRGDARGDAPFGEFVPEPIADTRIALAPFLQRGSFSAGPSARVLQRGSFSAGPSARVRGNRGHRMTLAEIAGYPGGPTPGPSPGERGTNEPIWYKALDIVALFGYVTGTVEICGLGRLALWGCPERRAAFLLGAVWSGVGRCGGSGFIRCGWGRIAGGGFWITCR